MKSSFVDHSSDSISLLMNSILPVKKIVRALEQFIITVRVNGQLDMQIFCEKKHLRIKIFIVLLLAFSILILFRRQVSWPNTWQPNKSQRRSKTKTKTRQNIKSAQNTATILSQLITLTHRFYLSHWIFTIYLCIYSNATDFSLCWTLIIIIIICVIHCLNVQSRAFWTRAMIAFPSHVKIMNLA